MSDGRDVAFLRPDEAAALAGLSKRAIYRAIELRRSPTVGRSGSTPEHIRAPSAVKQLDDHAP